MISRLACLLSVALLGSPLMAHAIDKGKESQAEDVIASLKAYPASKIFPGYADAPPRELPNIPLEKWLKSAVGDTPLEWRGGDCASHDSEIDGCSSFVVFVNTPNGRCPSISLRFVIRHDTTVYLMASESAVKQVYQRLGHHLAPTRFSWIRWQDFGIQLVCACIVILMAIRSRWQPTSR